jgi:hypothetical protein
MSVTRAQNHVPGECKISRGRAKYGVWGESKVSCLRWEQNILSKVRVKYPVQGESEISCPWWKWWEQYHIHSESDILSPVRVISYPQREQYLILGESTILSRWEWSLMKSYPWWEQNLMKSYPQWEQNSIHPWWEQAYPWWEWNIIPVRAWDHLISAASNSRWEQSPVRSEIAVEPVIAGCHLWTFPT